MTIANIAKDYSRSVLLRVKKNDYEELIDLFKPLISQGVKEIIGEGIQRNRVEIENCVDMRYVGQSHELTLPFKKSFIEDFHNLHKKTFGYANRDYEVEVVNIRVRVTGKTKKPSLRKKQKVSSIKNRKFVEKTKCFFRGRWLKVDVYDRNRVHASSRIKGPALIFEDYSTTFVLPEYVCNIDEYENLIIEKR